jgi:hypothetical protein
MCHIRCWGSVNGLAAGYGHRYNCVDHRIGSKEVTARADSDRIHSRRNPRGHQLVSTKELLVQIYHCKLVRDLHLRCGYYHRRQPTSARPDSQMGYDRDCVRNRRGLDGVLLVSLEWKGVKLAPRINCSDREPLIRWGWRQGRCQDWGIHVYSLVELHKVGGRKGRFRRDGKRWRSNSPD